MIKSFRGLMADEDKETITLHTNDGKTGYRIKEFKLMSANPGAGTAEHIVKIYSVPQTTVDGTVDFSDQTLLAAATLKTQTVTGNPETPVAVIFDNMIFNQDIYVTAIDLNDSNAVNYYIKLEQISLDLNEATVATLQSIRSS